MIEVLQPGTEVVIGNDIPGMVSGVMIEFGSQVSYRVVYWDGRVRKSEWLGPGEVYAKAVKPPKLAIGFGG